PIDPRSKRPREPRSFCKTDPDPECRCHNPDSLPLRPPVCSGSIALVTTAISDLFEGFAGYGYSKQISRRSESARQISNQDQRLTLGSSARRREQAKAASYCMKTRPATKRAMDELDRDESYFERFASYRPLVAVCLCSDSGRSADHLNSLREWRCDGPC